MSKSSSKELDDIHKDFFSKQNDMSPNDLRENIGYNLDLFWRKNRANYRCLDEIKKVFNTEKVLNTSHTNAKGPIILNKQQPSLIEAINETISRIKFMENMVENQPDIIDGIIMGGSLSYGRFVNIRGDYPNSSDLDLIIVTKDIPSTRQIKKIIPLSVGFTEDDQNILSNRMKNFIKLEKHGQAEMISHKFTSTQLGFDISTHFLDKNIFTKLCHPSIETEEPVSILDYKPKKFLYQTMKQKNVFGDEVLFYVSETNTDLGVITKLPIYSFQNHFVPGIYHNLISPMFELFYGSNDIYSDISDFQSFLSKQSLDITLSHPRKPLFSKYIISEINEKI